jgi:hypothetical protein
LKQDPGTYLREKLDYRGVLDKTRDLNINKG